MAVVKGHMHRVEMAGMPLGEVIPVGILEMIREEVPPRWEILDQRIRGGKLTLARLCGD